IRFRMGSPSAESICLIPPTVLSVACTGRRGKGGAEEEEDCKEVRNVADDPVAPTGKEIRLTEYAACAG
ncbi:MAG: hypothetical protein AAB254_05065, partial [candidate division NC10 bacterium]